MPTERIALRARTRTGRGRVRRWPALLLSICLALAALTACDPTAGNSAPDQLQAPAQSSAAAGSSSSTKLCGIPPCDRYLSRSHTRTLANTITDHPLVSALALHVVVSLICGGVLCILGEGFALPFVDHEAHVAEQNNECLRVRILPQGHEWELVNVDASNQSPYCTD